MFRRNKIKMMPNFGTIKKPVDKNKILPEEKHITSVAKYIPSIFEQDNISEIENNIHAVTFHDRYDLTQDKDTHIPELSNSGIDSLGSIRKSPQQDKFSESEENNFKKNLLSANSFPQKIKVENDEKISKAKIKTEIDEKNSKANSVKENVCVPDDNSSIIVKRGLNAVKPLEKVPARRTKIKGQPIIPSAKRGTTSIPLQKQEQNNNSISNNTETCNELVNKFNSFSSQREADLFYTVRKERNVENVASCNTVPEKLLDDTANINESCDINYQSDDNSGNITSNVIISLQNEMNHQNSKNILTSSKTSENIVSKEECISENNFIIIDKCKIKRNKSPLGEAISKEMRIKDIDISDKSSLGSPKLKKLKKSQDRKEMPVELTIGKKSFLERKQNYRNKLSSGGLDRKEMTMFDLIFWNPSTNPMPGSQPTEPNNRRRRNTIDDSASTANEEQNVEEEGLETCMETNKSESGETNNVSESKDDNEKINNQHGMDQEHEQLSDSDDESTSLAPQVKIGPNGELVVDEKSLVIQTTAAKNRDKVMSTAEVVEETSDTSSSEKWRKRRKRSTEWTRKETARFYKALSTVGTDFSLMETIFAWRSRQELKIKFKKEEKINRHLIDTALNDCTQFDFSIFDESDYDPEEDRKESKEAEKAEAKKKKEFEREQKKLEKEKEKKLKKEQESLEKLRKKKLKTIYKKRNRRKVMKSRRDSVVTIEPQELIFEVVLSSEETSDKQEERNITINEDNTLVEKPGNVISEVQSANDSAEDPLSNVPLDLSLSGRHEEEIQNISCTQIVDMGEDDEVTISHSLIRNEEVEDVSVQDERASEPTTCNPESIPVSDESISDIPVLEDGNSVPSQIPPFADAEKSAVGQQFLQIKTTDGPQKIPVPPYAAQTSNIVVMATVDPQDPSKQIYHVYTVAPMQDSSSNLTEIDASS